MTGRNSTPTLPNLFPLRLSLALSLFLLLAGAGACDPHDEDLETPAATEVVERYDYHGSLDAEMSGNVAQVTVGVDPAEIERGGPLWAKALPYLFLFSEATWTLFQEYDGLAGVRVEARDPGGVLISGALLERNTLGSAEWPEVLEMSAEAMAEGTEHPARMQDLVNRGEDRTSFEYNPDYTSE